MQCFREKLSVIYPDKEIGQFLYILFEEYLGWQKTTVHLSLDVEIPEPAIISFNLALEELQSGKPIQYILNKSWFNGTLLKVDANVLIPRPETEELCSIIKSGYHDNGKKQISILDIGTGSGCIAIDLKKHFSNAEVTAVDISIDALKIASENARANNCEISFIHADILNKTDRTELGKYNMIVSNPPYIAESEKILMHRNVTKFEPDEALYVTDHDPLLFYRAIAEFAIDHLVPPAHLYFEINERFGREVAEIVLSSGFDEVKILHDFHGKERFVTGVLKSH